MISFRQIPIFLLGLLLAPSVVFAATLEELKELVDKEKFDDAYLMAKAMSRDNIGKADFDYLYGMISQNAGHPEVAVFALERVLMLNPTDAKVMYDHGRALVAVDDLTGARQEFANVLAVNGITDDLRKNTNEVLGLVEEALRALDRSTSFNMTAAVDVGFNSNVNSGTSGPPVFPIQGAEVRDGFVNFGGTALIKRHLAKDFSFYVTLATDNRKNFTTVIYDSNSFSADFGFEFAFNKVTLRLPFAGEMSLGNYVIDRYNASSVPEVSYSWDDENFSTVSFGFGTKLFTGDPNNNYYSLPVTLSHWTASLVRGAGISTTLNYTPGLAFRRNTTSEIIHDELSLSLSGSVEVVPSHFLSPALTVMYLRYPVNLTATGIRNDANVTAQITYEWHITENWTLASSFSYNYGYSTDPGQTYQRFQPQVGLRYQL